MGLITRIDIPEEYRKRRTMAGNTYYDALDVYDNRVVGYFEGQQTMIWHFKDYIGIDCVEANMNSQFGQIVFLTGINSRSRVVGVDLLGRQNMMAMKDTNRILFCSGMFSFDKTNKYTESVAKIIRDTFENYTNMAEEKGIEEHASGSSADEIRKYKELLDDGIITEDEFNAKKQQLLGL